MSRVDAPAEILLLWDAITPEMNPLRIGLMKSLVGLVVIQSGWIGNPA